MKIHNTGHRHLMSASAVHCMIAVAMVALLVNSKSLIAQQAPSVGYAFPAGVTAGATTDIVLGGYDWTPDLEFFVSDKRVKLEIMSPIGDMMVPPPPYWFGPKARGPAMMIPREVKARITVPKELAGKSIRWQVANANGASAPGSIVIASGTHTEMKEHEGRSKPVVLSTLPVTVNGQLAKFEEVDEYRIRTTKAGLITCRVSSRNLGSPMQAVLRIHDDTGRLVADAVDTQNLGLNLTFRAEANQTYTLSLHDLDFRGNWSYVYRLHVAAGPRVVATIPASGKRGSETEVTFVGHGIATGAAKLESVTRRIRFPSTSTDDTFSYQLETKQGLTSPIEFGLSDFAELNERDCKGELHKVPTAVTGVFDQRNQSDRYKIALIKGQVLDISAKATCDESPLDMTLAIKNDEGKQLATNDDFGGTTNSHITFTVPKDGTYHIISADLANRGGRLDSTYRLSVLESHPDFATTVPTQAGVPLGGKVDLKIAATRLGLFKGDIGIAIEGLPDGMTIAADATIPSKKKDAKISITANTDGSSKAFRATVVARAVINEKTIEHRYPILIARTMKPRAKVTPIDKDGGRTVHRGTTYPAAVIVERLEGFTGPVILQMAAKQGRHRQGIDGKDVRVPPDVTRTIYPVYCPEWLETDRTSRMVVNAITEVTDPTGLKRFLSNKMDGRITMSLEGALLKLTGPKGVVAITPGDTARITVAVSRSPKLRETVKLALVNAPGQETKFIAAPILVGPGQTQATFSIRTPPNMTTPQSLTIRGVAMQDGHYPVVSQITVRFLASGKQSTSLKVQEAKQPSLETPHEQSTGNNKPNVLFIAVDDMRVELGCYGQQHIKSPNIDRLAARGTLFNRAYCQQAVCNPSRASLMTGMRLRTLNIWDLPTHFRQRVPNVITLPQLFKQNGYFTQNIGKIYHNWRQDKFKGDAPSWSVPAVMHYNSHGADKAIVRGAMPPNLINVPRCEMRDVPDDAYFDGRIATQAVEALRKLKDKRFFLAVGFWKPHAGFNAPKKYWDMYNRADVNLPANATPPKNVPKLALHDAREILRSFKSRPNGKPTKADILALRHGYYAAISYVDAQVGRVLDELKKLGLEKNTIVVFWSDHGFHLGEHGLWAKTSNFELDARVPMIIATPGQQKPQRTQSLAELLDLYPTLTDLCDLATPKHLEGKSLRPILNNPKASVKEQAFTWHPRPAYPPAGTKPHAMGFSMRTNRYRYTEWRDFKTKNVIARELYDHEVDTNETQNLAALKNHAALVVKLSQQLALTHPRRPSPEPALDD